jgi:hypothetical protein
MAATAAPGHRIAARLVLSARAADKPPPDPRKARRDQPRQASPPDRRENEPGAARPACAQTPADASGLSFFEELPAAPGDDFSGSVGSEPEIYPVYWPPAPDAGPAQQPLARVRAFRNSQ